MKENSNDYSDITRLVSLNIFLTEKEYNELNKILSKYYDDLQVLVINIYRKDLEVKGKKAKDVFGWLFKLRRGVE